MIGSVTQYGPAIYSRVFHTARLWFLSQLGVEEHKLTVAGCGRGEYAGRHNSGQYTSNVQFKIEIFTYKSICFMTGFFILKMAKYLCIKVVNISTSLLTHGIGWGRVVYYYGFSKVFIILMVLKP